MVILASHILNPASHKHVALRSKDDMSATRGRRSGILAFEDALMGI
jgi:hypothetical protein